MKTWKKRTDFTTISEIVKSRLSEEDMNISEPFVPNLKEAVDFVKNCIEKGFPITIVGDYDCDGITASSILKLGLKEYSGVVPEVIIPKRLSEGYGINMSIIDKIPCGLMITVDNGITAVEQIEYARKKGLNVVILDHHLKNDEGVLPNADVICDPSAEDGDYFKSYCGAGLAYRFIKMLNPNSKILNNLVTLAGIATIADVMQLKGHNRWLVLKALENISSKNVIIPLKILLETVNVGEYATEEDIKFSIAPLINAYGRLEDEGGQKLVNYLTVDGVTEEDTEDIELLKAEARDIKAHNELRKSLVAEHNKKAEEILLNEDKTPVIIIEDDNFKKGLVGIIAGDLTKKYGVPSIVLTKDTKKGILTGSARSPENLHLKNLLDRAKQYLLGYGGHKGAAGLSLKEENFEDFKECIKRLLIEDNYEPLDTNTIYYDIEIENSKDILKIYKELRKYAPYGEGNKELSFVFKGFNGTPMTMKDKHFKLIGADFTALGFYKIEDWEEAGKPTMIDLLGGLSLNSFNGQVTPQLKIEDFHKKEEEKTEVYNDLANMFIF